MIRETNLYHEGGELEEMMQNSIILDNGSTLSLSMNPDLVENIRASKTTLELATNPAQNKNHLHV